VKEAILLDRVGAARRAQEPLHLIVPPERRPNASVDIRSRRTHTPRRIP
jgi:hypothetical protein